MNFKPSNCSDLRKVGFQELAISIIMVMIE